MWFLFACSSDPKLPATEDSATVPVDSTPTDSATTDSVPTDSGTSTDTGTTPTEPCETAPDLHVVSVTAAQLTHPHEQSVSLTLSAEATAAVTCTLTSDPTEVHLVESIEPAISHTLRIGGLLAAETYDCRAAPVCPTMADTAMTFTITTGAGSRNLPPLNVTEVDVSYSPTEYLLLQHSDDCDWDKGQLFVTDRAGRVRWWYDHPAWVGPSLDFRYHGDNAFVWGGGWEANDTGRPRIVDVFDGETYDSAVAIPDVNNQNFHHDGKMIADGRLATLEQVDVEGRRGNFQGFQVRIIDPVAGTVDFTYHSQRAFDEEHLAGGSGDAWHANWVDVVDTNGRDTLYVSLCYVDTTAAIDATTGDWIWRFGPGGDFTLEDADGDPLSDDEYPQCQHGLEFVDGNLLVYDNGRDRGASRAAEYRIDESTMTATLLWTWTEPDWYESTLGDVDYLPNGNILVNAGHAECFSSNPGDKSTLYDINPVTGEKQWELQYNSLQSMMYRADWADACELFANAKYCPAVAERAAVLADAFDGG